jgi:hypothetical protein
MDGAWERKRGGRRHHRDVADWQEQLRAGERERRRCRRGAAAGTRQLREMFRRRKVRRRRWRAQLPTRRSLGRRDWRGAEAADGVAAGGSVGERRWPWRWRERATPCMVELMEWRGRDRWSL